LEIKKAFKKAIKKILPKRVYHTFGILSRKKFLKGDKKWIMK